MPNKKQGFAGVGLIIAILVIVGLGGYLWGQKSTPAPEPRSPAPISPSPTNSFKTLPAPNEEKCIILFNRRDGSGIPQKVNLAGKDYEINSYIETEDHWASFTVDGDAGSRGAYQNTWGNPLAVSGSGLSFPNKIVIKRVSITLKNIGIGANQQEFAETCLNKI